MNALVRAVVQSFRGGLGGLLWGRSGRQQLSVRAAKRTSVERAPGKTEVAKSGEDDYYVVFEFGSASSASEFV
jgi:hypothetical protein